VHPQLAGKQESNLNLAESNALSTPWLQVTVVELAASLHAVGAAQVAAATE
jgi:hypothetical protein